MMDQKNGVEATSSQNVNKALISYTPETGELKPVPASNPLPLTLLWVMALTALVRAISELVKAFIDFRKR